MTYWLGTDDQGRDMLSAIFYGLRISLAVALVSVLIALTLGTFVGLYAAYHGGGRTRSSCASSTCSSASRPSWSR